MYTKGQSLSVKSSASLLCNNLAVLPGDDGSCSKLAVVHKAVVWILDVKGKALKDDGSIGCQEVVCRGEGAQSSNAILQVKWCVLPERTILVVAAVKGAQMFDEDGSLMVFWQSLAPNPVEGLAQYARGITTAGSSYICLGTADGSILVYDVPSKGTSVRLQDTLVHHNPHSIADLASSADGQTMASADENGAIIIWTVEQSLEMLCRISGEGYPCSSVLFYRNMVIGAYGSGHIRIFDSQHGGKLAEICAHARWINAIDIAPLHGLLASAAEDTSVRVWKLTEEPFSVECTFQDSIASVQLCGVQFLSDNGESLAVTGYDSQHITMYHMS